MQYKVLALDLDGTPVSYTHLSPAYACNNGLVLINCEIEEDGHDANSCIWCGCVGVQSGTRLFQGREGRYSCLLYTSPLPCCRGVLY